MYKWKLNPVQSGKDSQYGEMLLISQINLKKQKQKQNLEKWIPGNDSSLFLHPRILACQIHFIEIR